MDYNEEQRLRVELKGMNEAIAKATTLVEAVVRRHPEQDAKLAALNVRLERLEKILRVEIEDAEKVNMGIVQEPKKGLIGRMLGR
jgi:uncharacterized protein with gpF-like domain